MTKKNVLIILSVILAIAIIAVVTFGISIFKTEKRDSITYGVIDLGTTVDSNGTLAKLAVSYLYDTFKGGSCSAVVKTLDNGDTIIGRNLDLTLSNTPVYVGSTNLPGYYETMYISYITDYGPDYDEAISKGIPGYVLKTIPFASYDSLNSEGLYIQINMRMDQQDDEGNYIFSCSHTNPDSDTRISAVELPTYVTLRCSDVDEAIELIESLDIYTMGGDVNWPFSYIIADSKGNYGLLELGCNEVRWIPNQNIQTNFYISEDFNLLQKYKQGIGRYEYLENNLSSVNSESDMLNLLEGVKYSGIYDENNPNFDIRSEMAGDKEYVTTDYLYDDENWESFKEDFRSEVDIYNSLSDEEKRNAGIYWESIYTAIVNLNDKTIDFNFFENYYSKYTFNFSNIKDEETIVDFRYAIVFSEIFSIIISLILIYGNMYETRRNEEKTTERQKIYSVLVITNIFGLITDAISWYYDGDITHLTLNTYATGLSLVITYILIGEFCLYLYALLKEKDNVNELSFRLYMIACVIAVIITAVMYKTGLFYTIDESGIFYEAPLYTFYTTMNGVFMVSMIMIIFFYRKLLGPHDFISVCVYVLAPILSAIVCFFIPEASYGYTATTLASLIIYITLQSDKTNKIVEEKNISSYMANHDELTNLLSRHAYIDKIDELEKIEGSDKNVGVIFADINGLKYTNDRFGHLKGDELLIHFSDAVKRVFSHNEVYRISGDEFVIILPSISKETLAKKAIELGKELNKYEYELASCGTCYGVCKKINELISFAETDMYEKKKEFYILHPEMKR